MNADKIISLQGHLETQRTNFDSHWQDVAEYVAPRQNYFQSTRTQGERVNQKIFDSTAIIANNRFAASMSSLMTPANQIWHKLILAKRQEASQEIKEYLDTLNELLFSFRYRAMSNFGTTTNEVYLDLGAFGNGVMFTGYDIGKGPVYTSCGLEGMYWLTDEFRRINLVHRRYKITSRQMLEQFGEDALPEMVLKDLKKNGMKEWEIIHAVYPNQEREEGRSDFKGMAWRSYYVLRASNENKKILSEGGYRTMPYSIARYSVASQETYGRSVAMECFPDIKTVNQMGKTNLRAGHNAVEPPLIASEDLNIGLKMYPGAINYGGIDSMGNDVVKPLLTGANLPIALELENQRRQSINNSFLVNLFQILVEGPQMTATEVMQRAQEKGVLLGPVYSRMQAEFFGPLIPRELDILDMMGVLPEPPEELLEMGAEYEVEYQSPLAKAAKSEEGIAILRTLEAAAPLAEIDPDVAALIKAEESVRELANIYGMPARLLKSEEEMEQYRQAKNEDMEMQQMLQAAPVAASAAKDLAQAQQMELMEPEPILGVE